MTVADNRASLRAGPEGRRIVPVVLSGGSGSRLWPLSRPNRPKQLLPLFDSKTLLQLTALRTSGPPFSPPVIVTAAAYAGEIEGQLRDVSISPAAIICEPCPRNTAPAIALAAAVSEPGDILVVMPSDHAIGDVTAFLAAIELAVPMAAKGQLVTFGLHPLRPETGFGYIECGEAIAAGIHKAAKFHEKPPLELAEEFVASGRHCWNSGIFMFTAAAIRTEMTRHARDVIAAVDASLSGIERGASSIRPSAREFAQAPSISIDHAVMEQSDKVAIVPVSIGWSDVGSWDALCDLQDLLERDQGEQDRIVTVNARNCAVRTNGPTVAVVGIDDIIVVATADAVLVIPKGESQQIRHVVDELKARNDPSLRAL